MLKRFFKSDAKKYALIAGGIGALVYLLLFGYRSLIITNVSYIYNAKDRILAMSDLPYHQLGLDYFLREGWNFPPGNIRTYPYPYGTSILISDSLPLFAFVAKLFAGILPEYFQYFGIWTLLCFILQGVCAALILRRLGVRLLPAMCAVPLFLINVPLLFRCFHHCALCGQWLILLAFLGYLYSDELKFTEKTAFWTTACILCVLIQGYFLLICGAVMAAALLGDVIKDRKKIVESIMIIGISVLSSLLVFYLCGGFYGENRLAGTQLGRFLFDVSYLIDPYIFSSFFSGNRMPDKNTEHGAYLGVALIILYLIAFAVLLLKRKEAFAYLKRNKSRKVILALMLSGFFLISLGPKVQFFGETVIDLLEVLPQKVLDYLAVFRSSARFFWPVWYIMLIAVIRILTSVFKDKRSYIFCLMLAACAIVQYVELPERTIETKAYTDEKGYSSAFDSAFADCFNEKAAHLSVVSNKMTGYEDVIVYAVHHGLTTNLGNLGRGKWNSIADDKKRLAEGRPENDTIYVINLRDVDGIEMSELPPEYVYYFDNEKYLCIFDKALLKAEPDCMKIDPGKE